VKDRLEGGGARRSLGESICQKDFPENKESKVGTKFCWPDKDVHGGKKRPRKKGIKTFLGHFTRAKIIPGKTKNIKRKGGLPFQREDIKGIKEGLQMEREGVTEVKTLMQPGPWKGGDICLIWGS